MSGFVSVGEAGRDGNAIVAVVVLVLVAVCKCMLPQRTGTRVAWTFDVGVGMATRSQRRRALGQKKMKRRLAD